MELSNRIEALHYLGEHLRNLSEDDRDELYARARNENPWFVPAFTKLALDGITQWLNRDKLSQWVSKYGSLDEKNKAVGLVLAGNLPLVGFHDLLSVLISGCIAQVKLSSQDSVLMGLIIKSLKEVEPLLSERIKVVNKLENFDAVIATGSDNSSRYFERYFGKYPNIIRKNRTSIAVLNGHESSEELGKLADDVFLYFGLGCRNVSKIFVPKDYEWDAFIEASVKYESHFHHHKYVNNYDYNKSVYLVNRIPHLDSGFFMIKEDSTLVSPMSVIFYETYTSREELGQKLALFDEKIQCLVSQNGWFNNEIPFGKAQFPELNDYADGVDTLEFLSRL